MFLSEISRLSSLSCNFWSSSLPSVAYLVKLVQPKKLEKVANDPDYGLIIVGD